MKQSIKPTSHIIIRSSTTSNWDNVDFAIIEVTAFILGLMDNHISIMEQFKSDESLHNVSYWTSPLSYYCNPETVLYAEEIIPAGKDWAFIMLDPEEEKGLATPKNQLEGHQMVITKNGYANFKALSKCTNEEYFTESFLMREVLIRYAC